MTVLRALGLTLIFALSAIVPAWAVSAFAPPVVVVYPLTLSGVVTHAEVGSDVAIVLGTKIAEGGSVTVRPHTPGTTRAMFLEAAIKEKADYYVTGYLQQIGSDVSMILQVVSTHSGSVVFSNTSTIKTFGDAAAEAEPVREAILRHAGRGLAALDAPPPATAPTAAPTTNQGVNLTRALRRRGKATPSPSPSPTSDAGLVPVSEIQASIASPTAKPTAAVVVAGAAALPSQAPIPSPTRTPTPAPTPTLTPVPTNAAYVAPPSIVVVPQTARVGRPGGLSTTLVIDTGGPESETARARTSNSLLAALRQIGVPAARLTIGASVLTGNAQSICRANPGTEHFLEPVVTLGHDTGGASLAKLSVTSVDCTGATTAQRQVTSIGTAVGGDESAIDRATLVIAPQLSGM